MTARTTLHAGLAWAAFLVLSSGVSAESAEEQAVSLPA